MSGLELLLGYLCVLLVVAWCLLWCVRHDERAEHAERLAEVRRVNEQLAREVSDWRRGCPSALWPRVPARVPVSEQQWQQVVSAFVRPDATDCPPAERGPS